MSSGDRSSSSRCEGDERAVAVSARAADERTDARARRARAMVKDSRDAIGTLTLERVCRLRDAGTRSENARARDRCSESEHRGGEERRSNASVFARAKGEMKTRRRARRLTFS
jgi:hypothetical protein|tara:strand:+ start:129 stop:467 length:339 start_codon:yes stop_codon:yes gene_type:complete